LYTVLLSYD